MKEEEIELIPGSKYVVYSASNDKDAMVTSGEFIGYTYIGKEEGGICIKMDESHGSKKGLIRIIPISAIFAIDVVEKKKRRRKKKGEEATHYFS